MPSRNPTTQPLSVAPAANAAAASAANVALAHAPLALPHGDVDPVTSQMPPSQPSVTGLAPGTVVGGVQRRLFQPPTPYPAAPASMADVHQHAHDSGMAADPALATMSTGAPVAGNVVSRTTPGQARLAPVNIRTAPIAGTAQAVAVSVPSLQAATPLPPVTNTALSSWTDVHRYVHTIVTQQVNNIVVQLPAHVQAHVINYTDSVSARIHSVENTLYSIQQQLTESRTATQAVPLSSQTAAIAEPAPRNAHTGVENVITPGGATTCLLYTSPSPRDA